MNTEPDNAPRSTEPAGRPLPFSGQERKSTPKRIGKYEVLDVISATKMGVVYKVNDPEMKRVVALKMPARRAVEGLESGVRERFLRERNIAAQLNHAGILPVHDQGEEQDFPFYTMPYVEGRSLLDEVEMAKPALDQRLELFLRLCKVSGDFHRAGYVHRDLKPENVMVDKNGDLRLFDFGLAKSITKPLPKLTLDDQFLGTPEFMAPEQTPPNDPDDITPAADIHALGVVLYWLLTGEHPYSFPNRSDKAAVTEAIRTAAPKPPSQVGLRPPVRFDALVLRCLRKNPAERPQTAAALADELKAVIEGPVVGTAPAASGTASQPNWLPWVAGAAALLALALALFPRNGAKDTRGKDSLPTPSPLSPAQPPTPAAKPTALPDAPPALVASSEAPNTGTTALVPVTPLPRVNTPVPTALWPLYSHAKAALHDDFDKRRMGAVLLQWQPGQAGARPATIRLVASSGSAAAPQRVEPNGAAVFYAPAGTAVFELVTTEEVTRWSVSVIESEVTYGILR